MFCEKCGKKNPDNASFCESCGAKLVNPAPQAASQASAPQGAPQAAPDAAPQRAPQQTMTMTPPAPKPEKKPFPENILEKLPPVIRNNIKIVCIAAAGFIVALITLIVILVTLSNNVDLEEFITIKSSGYDKYGDVEYDIDYDALIVEITGDEISSDLDDYDSWEDLFSASASAVDYSAIRSAVDVEAVYPEGKSDGSLSNGDVVKYNVTFEPAVADKFDVDVDPVTIEHEVEGLGSASVFNALADATVTFEGYNGVGKATISVKEFEKTVGALTFMYSEGNDYISYSGDDIAAGRLYISLDRENAGLSNGDKINLIISNDIEADALSSSGVILEGLTKEVVVEGLEESKNYDIMANFDVKATGVDGVGKASITAKESEVTIGNITFTTSPDNSDCVYYEDSTNSYNSGRIYIKFSTDYTDLSNDDKVAIYADIDEDRLAEYGVILTNMSKEVTVSGLGQYVKKLADINKDSLNAFFNEIKEDLSNRLYDDWGKTVHNSYRDFDGQSIGKDMKLYKTIITTPKNTASTSKNTLWFVVSVTLKDDSMEEDTPYYFYYSLADVAVDTDKNLSIADDHKINKSYGFTDYNKMYEDHIEEFNLNIEVSK